MTLAIIMNSPTPERGAALSRMRPGNEVIIIIMGE